MQQSESQGAGGAISATAVPVWDLPLRLFHWALAVVVLTGIAAIKLDDINLHVRCGQIVLALLLFRLVWGFVGPEHARFASFVRGPGAILSYARSLVRAPHEFHAGHNPLGGMVVVLMLALLLFQAVSGLFANDDIFTEGPLVRFISKSTSDAITGLHYRNSWLIIGLIALHITAVFGYLVRFRENLIRPMFSGIKQVPSGARAIEIDSSRSGRALIVFVSVAGVVWLLFDLPQRLAPVPY